MYVTPVGNKGVVAIEAQDLVLNGGEVLDVVARNPAIDNSEGPPPQLIVIDHGHCWPARRPEPRTDAVPQLDC